MEMGFLENEVVEVKNIAPWGKDPMAVRVRGTTVALRKAEACLILVEVK
jgi:Fe2+ transport system protein FeoA